MSSEKWTQFWESQGRNSLNEDLQSQVKRTFAKEAISSEKWAQTLSYIDEQINPLQTDTMLDLCCGNGLLTEFFSKKVKSVTAVDVSQDFVDSLESKHLPNVTTLQEDALKTSFPENSFDIVVVYAAIQYFSESETIVLLEKISKWLKPRGRILIGDIPDKARLWNFYNTTERVKFYFDNARNNEDVVGTWFDKTWLRTLLNNCGIINVESIDQPEYQIYSHFRFDIVGTKQ